MVYVIEHDFCNPHIQEHLHLAFDNVPVIKVENTPIDDSSRKRSRKRKSIKKPEQVWLVKVNLFLSQSCGPLDQMAQMNICGSSQSSRSVTLVKRIVALRTRI